MIRFKNVVIVFVSVFLLYSCNNNRGPQQDNFDHEAQALIDNDSLVKYFENHYYDDAIDSIKPMTTGQTALINDSRLKVKDVTEQEVDYKLYYFIQEQGIPVPAKGNPSVVDSILVRYRGERFVRADSLIVFEEIDLNPIWITLNSTIRGWSYSFPEFKGGENISQIGEPINYINVGKGIVFIPSGLAYRNVGNTSIPPNAPLQFYFSLLDIVPNTDHDLDSIPAIKEDVDNDGDPRNDDTDGDRVPDYLDVDDDNDGILTRNEDRDGDGDPTNDFNDPDNPNLPDYLNPNIRVNTSN